MLSYDTIMTHKYFELNTHILNHSVEIGKLLGIVDSTFLRKPSAKLRKANQIKSIQSSLAIEGNTLTEEQVTAILNNQKVIGPSKDILEVKNAIETYNNIQTFKYHNESSYKKAHKSLMKGLIKNAGKYRTSGVGIFKGSKPTHIAPPAWNVPNLMRDLFKYLKNSNDNYLIKSCVFHYEMEFIHPFLDGNGRMGRLWQTVILMNENPVFEFLPIEHEIKKEQSNYYKALELSDKQGKCTEFVVYMLSIIKSCLSDLITTQRQNFTDEQRLKYFVDNHTNRQFVRKDYMNVFKNISTATASRDLKKGVELGLWEKLGDNRKTIYTIT